MIKTKVMYYLEHLGLGGTEKTAVLFAQYLNREKFDVAFAYEESRGGPRLDHLRDLAEKSETELTLVPVRTDRASQSSSLWSATNSYQPDIFHVFRSGEPRYPGSQDVVAGNFVVTNVFGLLDHADPGIRSVLYMSKWLHDASIRHYGSPPQVPAFLPGGAAYNKDWGFTWVNNPVESPFSQAKLDIGIDSDTIVLGRIGRPDPGIYDSIALNGARLAQMLGEKIHFLAVATPQPMIDDLVEFDIPHTLIEPTVDPVELSKFYNTVDIYCHARADGETFGVNIAEAMIHGKPVITHIATQKIPNMSVFQSQTELVDHGETGFICRTPREYCDFIRTLCRDKDMRESFGEMGERKAIAEYQTDPVIGKLEGIYHEIVAS